MNDQHLFSSSSASHAKRRTEQAVEEHNDKIVSHRPPPLGQKRSLSCSSSSGSQVGIQKDVTTLPNCFATMSIFQDSGNTEAFNLKTSMSTASSSVLNGISALDCGLSVSKTLRNSSSSSTAVVIHTYTDYSDLPEDLQELPPEFDENNNMLKRNTGGVSTTFPERLHQLLTENKFPDIVCWLPHGRCFIVQKTKEFESLVMHVYFTHTKITSFQRQLNLYGFKRLTKGADRGSYYHEFFLRGMPKLCTRMRRQKVKGTGTKPLPDPDNEPNFYVMKSLHPVVANEGQGGKETSQLVENANGTNTRTADEIISSVLCKSTAMPQMLTKKSMIVLPNRENIIHNYDAIRKNEKASVNCSEPQDAWLEKQVEFCPLKSPHKNNYQSTARQDMWRSAEFAASNLPEDVPFIANESGHLGNIDRRQSIEFARELWRGTYQIPSAPNQDNVWLGKQLEASDRAHPGAQAIQTFSNESEDISKLDRRRLVEFAHDLWNTNPKQEPPRESINRAGLATHRRSSLKRSSFTSIDSDFLMGNDIRTSRRPSVSRGAVCRLSHTRLSITSLGSFTQTLQTVDNAIKAGRRTSLMSWGSSGSIDLEEDLTDMFQRRMSLISIGSSLLNFKKAVGASGTGEPKAHSDGSCAWVEDGILNRRHSLMTELDYDNLFDDNDVTSV